MMKVILSLLVLAVLITGRGDSPETAQQFQCLSNAKQLSIACHMYAIAYDDWMPANVDLIRPYLSVGENGQIPALICPAATDQSTSSYTLVPLGKLSAIESPDTTVLIRENAPTIKATGP